MGIFKLKTAIAGITSVLAASCLFADAPVDMAMDDDANEFEQYWYYYDDNAGVGENDRPHIAPSLTPSVIQVPFTEGPREAFGDKGDTWKVKKYTFAVTESMNKKCATMPFKMGDAWEAGYCSKEACAMPFVGIGTMLAKDSASVDLTGAEKVKFLIKSRKSDLKVRFKIQTLQIDQFSNKPADKLTGKEFGYYGVDFTVSPGDWQPQEIAIGDLELPSGNWAEEIDFDITKCTKLAWEVTGDDEHIVDTLDIAEVKIIGDYEFVSPSIYTETVAERTPFLFHTFDKSPYNQSPLKTYWYAYNDVEIGGSSQVTEDYATKDDSTGLLKLNFLDETGYDNKGKGAALEYEIGKPVKQKSSGSNDSVVVKGFVGIGCNLYDSAKCAYFNADSAGVKGVYFEYMTIGDAKFITLEISDVNDVADKDNPDRKDTRGSGIVYYRNFPNTEGKWRRVYLPFDKLIVHDDWKGYNHIDFNTKKLAKIQWKVQGAEGMSGAYAIDNIGLPDAEFGVKDPVKNISAKIARTGFAALYRNGKIRVDWNSTAAFSSGKISVVDMKGAVVHSHSIANSKALSTTISADNLSAGIYLVRLNAMGVDGKVIEKKSQISILK